MLNRIFTSFLGNRNQRVLRRFWKIVEKINAMETTIASLSDQALQAKTPLLKEKIKKGESLDNILPEAFALVREGAKRTLNMRHFDVQLIGGMVLHGGNIAEMRTGEGKTLAATLAAYLNALTEKGVHIVTVNDYLAKRDAEWMRPLYEFLGMTVGVNLQGMLPHEKQKAYAAHITYGTNNEFGFDYLRDNMVFSPEEKVQRGLHYAIVDEVDSILIDEARTPLIISGASEGTTSLYMAINQLIPELKKQAIKEGPGDYFLDEKSKQAFLTEEGHQRIEELLLNANLLKENESLYDAHNIILMHHIYAALRAQTLFHRDVEYIVKNGEIVIVDEHTGRTMPGRRWSEGLHQAIEAKEKVKINQENQTLASITFQNYFRLYQKLSGMTGTADTEAYEFQQIYGLEVVVIPTHKTMIRQDAADFVYMSLPEKFAAIVKDIKETHQKGQPILVGTASIEASEHLSELLEKENINHQVLNAKFHEKEAQIVAEAGRLGSVTIATNMAGRGTDIVLGGNLESELKSLENASAEEIAARKLDWQKRHQQVVEAGGLYVLGTERHESRRIDNQLRGRSGRQGDPGRSRFYLSLQDNLMRIFGGDRLNAIMQRIGIEKGAVLESRMLSRSIENAQRKVEAYNFDVRKQLLEYDDVANEQRKVVYRQRDELLTASNTKERVHVMLEEVAAQLVRHFVPPGSMEEEWELEGLEKHLRQHFNLNLPFKEWLEKATTLSEEDLQARLRAAFHEKYTEMEEKIGASEMHQLEKGVILQIHDTCWREHLAAIDYLRQGIHLRGYAQKNPKQEYKREAFELFTQFLEKVNEEVVATLTKVEIDRVTPEAFQEAIPTPTLNPQSFTYQHNPVNLPQVATVNAGDEEEDRPIQSDHPYIREVPKIGRNEPCPCGSQKKYKQCHGRLG